MKQLLRMANLSVGRQLTNRWLTTLDIKVEISWKRYIQGRNEVRWRPGQDVWRPHVRNWGLSGANILYWRRYVWHCWDFSALPEVIRRPEICALLSSHVTLLDTLFCSQICWSNRVSVCEHVVLMNFLVLLTLATTLFLIVDAMNGHGFPPK